MKFIFNWLKRKKNPNGPKLDLVGENYFLVTHLRWHRVYAIAKSDEMRFSSASYDDFFCCYRIKKEVIDLQVPFYFGRGDLEHNELMTLSEIPRLFS